MEATVSAAGSRVCWMLITAIAPIAWGSNYYVMGSFLPADAPLWGAVLRALPAGLVLLLVARKLPKGAWWWRALVLGTINMSAFFALVYVASQLLPSSIASMIMAASPIVMMVFAVSMLGERLRLLPVIGAATGLLGVVLMLASGTSTIDWRGVLASVAAMALASFGFVLVKRWGSTVEILPLTAWQLAGGGLVLLPVALVIEGPMPSYDVPAIAALAYVGLVSTALAYLAWFSGLKHLTAGTTGLIGLLNPVTGVVLGTLLAGETLGWQQGAGMGLVLFGILLGQPILRRRADLLV
ncbi:EamA family transporter [Pseudoclavibacter sp. AY1F1]|uniref:DMT family transporter n=1 Tax=Pseudoclavibacter sp. AY1F1 TaxID=2080583 RepID=UPI000CE8246E|nr:EamA family transporter [Pseudoclavibacter sp. AY1F1]PPF42342.1 EamA family transporter [Pseudoclavibacter sp. AY1F1]